MTKALPFKREKRASQSERVVDLVDLHGVGRPDVCSSSSIFDQSKERKKQSELSYN